MCVSFKIKQTKTKDNQLQQKTLQKFIVWRQHNSQIFGKNKIATKKIGKILTKTSKFTHKKKTEKRSQVKLSNPTENHKLKL